MPLDPSHDLGRYVTALEERFGADLVSVVLFGSRARGTARPDSDVDLLVVARDLPGSRLARQRILLRLARSVSAEFADALMPVPLTPEEAVTVKPYYLGMLSGHRILRDTGGFFAGVLAVSRRASASSAPGVTWTRTATSTGTSSPTGSRGTWSRCDVRPSGPRLPPSGAGTPAGARHAPGRGRSRRRRA